jgi:hypothetical protein
MKILSWDVGIINLSYCILEYNEDTKENKILFWGIINLIDDPIMKKNMNLVFENIPKKLDENKFLLDVDAVVIENQPSLKNPKMKSIQMIVYSYFLMYGKVLNHNENKIQNVDFCNASNKLKVYKGPEISLDDLKKKKKKVDNNSLITDFTEEKKDLEIVDPKTKKSIKLSYTDKKKMAVAHVKYFLKESQDEDNLEFFNEHKKKDDLADSYLQGLYVINIKLKKK